MKKKIILTSGAILTLPLLLTTLPLGFIPLVIANFILSKLGLATFSAIFLSLTLPWQITWLLCALLGCFFIVKTLKTSEQVCHKVFEDKNL